MLPFEPSAIDPLRRLRGARPSPCRAGPCRTMQRGNSVLNQRLPSARRRSFPVRRRLSSGGSALLPKYRYGDSNPGFRTEKSLNALRPFAAVSPFPSLIGDSGKTRAAGQQSFAAICGYLRLAEDILLLFCCRATACCYPRGGAGSSSSV